MELYQLRTFLTVADEGHLTRAAEKLFTSQPAISTQLRALEEELGVRLFDRSSKGMALTSAGVALQDQARRIVNAARDFKLSAEALRDTVTGELVFGLNNRPEILRLMEILRNLTTDHPDLRYEMVCGSSGVILQGLDEGTISIGFFEGDCSSQRLTWHHLDDVELCIAAPAEWAAELATPDWKKLEAKPWIFGSPMCSYFRTVETICREQGLQLRPRFRINEDLTVLNLVAEGLAVTLTAVAQVAASGLADKIVILPHFRASVPLCIGYQTARAHEPAIAAVRDAVLRIWKSARPSAPAKPALTLTLTPEKDAPRRLRPARLTRPNRRQP
jgi:DNA-binding transcriptional LysR family regulator